MSSKTNDANKKNKKKKKSQSLISKLNAKLLRDRGRHCFQDWFSDSEIDSFRDNPDINALEPLFVRYQEKMEAALEDFAAVEGLRDSIEIIDALRECRDDQKDEWKKLDKLIDTMTKKEEFFIMMVKKAERTFAKRNGNSGGGSGGKSADAGSKTSSSSQSNKK